MENTNNDAKFLSVAQLIADLQGMPQDAEVTCAMAGIGMSIPIVGIMAVALEQNRQIIVMTIDPVLTVEALKHAHEQDKVNNGASTN